MSDLYGIPRTPSLILYSAMNQCQDTCIFIDNICKNNTDFIDKGQLIPNSGLTSSHLASFVSCGFSFLLFSVFDDGFAVNIDSKADICPFFDFGPSFCSFEAQERKVVMKLIHVHVHVLYVEEVFSQQTDGRNNR